jgi:hypothetical protein
MSVATEATAPQACVSASMRLWYSREFSPAPSRTDAACRRAVQRSRGSDRLALRPVVAPLPAFAQVVEAMRAVRTAQWQEAFSTYDVATKKANRFVVMHSARLDPRLYRQRIRWNRTARC